jgi:hypothetical protein
MKLKFILLFTLFSSVCNGQVSNFCHTGLDGKTTKIILMNGGTGKLNILSNNVLTRSGNISWSSTTSNFPNPEIIRIKLSTGAILKFEAVKTNQLNGNIDMIIDSRGNQYINCLNNIYNEDEEDKEDRAFDAAYNKNSMEVREFEENKMDSYFEELQGTWSIISDYEDIFLVIKKDNENPDNLIVTKYELDFKNDDVMKITVPETKFHLESKLNGLYDLTFKWTIKLEFGGEMIYFKPHDFDTSKRLNYRHHNYRGNVRSELIKTNDNDDIKLLESIDSFNENMANYNGSMTKKTIRYVSEAQVDFPVLFDECLDDYKKQEPNSGENSLDYYLNFAKEKEPSMILSWDLQDCFNLNLRKHIQNEMKLKNVSGSVYLYVGVVKDGSIGYVKVVRGVNKEMDQEAIRIIKAIPSLIPAIIDGEFVDSSIQINVTF